MDVATVLDLYDGDRLVGRLHDAEGGGWAGEVIADGTPSRFVLATRCGATLRVGECGRNGLEFSEPFRDGRRLVVTTERGA